jgi:hypothetical protein
MRRVVATLAAALLGVLAALPAGASEGLTGQVVTPTGAPLADAVCHGGRCDGGHGRRGPVPAARRRRG